MPVDFFHSNDHAEYEGPLPPCYLLEFVADILEERRESVSPNAWHDDEQIARLTQLLPEYRASYQGRASYPSPRRTSSPYDFAEISPPSSPSMQPEGTDGRMQDLRAHSLDATPDRWQGGTPIPNASPTYGNELYVDAATVYEQGWRISQAAPFALPLNTDALTSTAPKIVIQQYNTINVLKSTAAENRPQNQRTVSDALPHFLPPKVEDTGFIKLGQLPPSPEEVNYIKLWPDAHRIAQGECSDCLMGTEYYAALQKPLERPDMLAFYWERKRVKPVIPERSHKPKSMIHFMDLAKDRRAPGTSLQNAARRNFSLSDALACPSELDDVKWITFKIELKGIKPTTTEILTSCRHGKITKGGLMHVIGRIFQKKLEDPTIRHLKPNVAPVRFLNRLRLITLYKGEDTGHWYAQLGHSQHKLVAEREWEEMLGSQDLWNPYVDGPW